MKKKYIKLISSLTIMMCMVAGIFFAVTNSKADDGRLWLAASSEEYSVSEDSTPTKDGYLFAGYYEKNTDNTYTVLATKPETSDYYVKFVPAAVLGIKAQVSSSILNDDVDTVANNMIRFVTSIDDSLDYQEVGFRINVGGYYEDDVEVDKYVYTTIYGVGATTATAETYNPSIFDNASKYFKTFTYTDIPEAYFNTDMTVTPYWITKDGTRVNGTTSIRTANYCRGWIYVDSVGTAANTDAPVGTSSNPYSNLQTALDVQDFKTLVPKVILKSNYALSGSLTVSQAVTLASVKETDGNVKSIVAADDVDATAFTNSSYINVAGGATLNLEDVQVDATIADAHAVYVPDNSATEVYMVNATLNTSDAYPVYVVNTGILTMTKDSNTSWNCSSEEIESFINCAANTNNVYYLTFLEAWNAGLALDEAATITMTNDITLTEGLAAVTKVGTNLTIDGQDLYTITTQLTATDRNVIDISVSTDEGKVNLNFKNVDVVHKTQRALVGVGAQSNKVTSIQIGVDDVDVMLDYTDTSCYLEYGLFNLRDNATILMNDVNVTTVGTTYTKTDRGIIRVGNPSDESGSVTVYARLQNCALNTSNESGLSVARINAGNTLNISCQNCILTTKDVYAFNKESDGTLTATVDTYTNTNSVAGTKSQLHSGGTYNAVDNIATAGASINGFLYDSLTTAWADAQLLDGYVTVKMLQDCSYATSEHGNMTTANVDITLDGQGYTLTTGATSNSINAFYIKNDNITLTLKNMNAIHLSKRALVNVYQGDSKTTRTGVKVILENMKLSGSQDGNTTVNQYGLINIRNNAYLKMKGVTVNFKGTATSLNGNTYCIIHFGNGSSSDHEAKTMNAELEDCTVNISNGIATVFYIPAGHTVTIKAKGCNFSTYKSPLICRSTKTNVTLNWYNSSTWTDSESIYTDFANNTSSETGYEYTVNSDLTE